MTLLSLARARSLNIGTSQSIRAIWRQYQTGKRDMAVRHARERAAFDAWEAWVYLFIRGDDV